MRRKLADNYKRVRERIAAACKRARRSPEEVRLIAVTKTVEVDVIRSAIELGMLDLGESRVQELAKRAGMVHEHLLRRRMVNPETAPPDPRWHMVGHLQRNKVKPVLPWADYIHSLDSLRLAEEISVEAGRQNKTIPVLVEVNVSGEKSKFGMAVGAVSHFVSQVGGLAGLRIIGLMTMAPNEDKPEATRVYFSRLREVFDDIRGEGVAGPEFRELSMGMSHDFEVAIEEGATMVRVGSALFDGIASRTSEGQQ
jgi:pyridoxal phosphate enzyme (YggS family)